MIFHEISGECYKWLKIQPNVKEESLTDWLLYQAYIRSKRVYYHAFTKNKEISTCTNVKSVLSCISSP